MWQRVRTSLRQGDTAGSEHGSNTLGAMLARTSLQQLCANASGPPPGGLLCRCAEHVERLGQAPGSNRAAVNHCRNTVTCSQELLEGCIGAAVCKDARPSSGTRRLRSGTRSQGGFRGSRPDWLELHCIPAVQGLLQGPDPPLAWRQNPAISAADPDTVLGSKVRPVQVAIPSVGPLTNASAV